MAYCVANGDAENEGETAKMLVLLPAATLTKGRVRLLAVKAAGLKS